MRAVVQRVTHAEVRIDGRKHSHIAGGLLVLVGVEREDTQDDAQSLARKVTQLRIFEDRDGKMNHSVVETGGAVLAVSQFTVLGDARRGRRPSFERAASPEAAQGLYDCFVAAVRRTGIEVATGVFQAMMDVELTNSGPVTILLDTRRTL